MVVFGNELKDRLLSAGWELIESRTILHLWVAEIWQIKSVWSPTDCVVYLTFEIDFQANPKDASKVDQVKASLRRPIDWFVEQNTVDVTQLDEHEYNSASVFLGRGRVKNLDEFILHVASLRHEFEILGKE